VDGYPGYGVCLGEEPVRGYCLAVVDALMQHDTARNGSHQEISAFLAHHQQRIAEREQREFNLILQSQVDFKLMEEE
jgi:alpha-D-ribose 1-methylphosphonate 5-triphosphate synthase subunit PhnG